MSDVVILKQRIVNKIYTHFKGNLLLKRLSAPLCHKYMVI